MSNKKNIQITLPVNTIEALDKIVEASQSSRSIIINLAIIKMINDLAEINK